LILDSVMKKRGDREIGIFPVCGLCYQARDFQKMIEVRFLSSSFTTLMDVPFSGGICGH
jgi:hypothetical protein